MKDIGMHKEIVQWLGREFVFLSCEGAGGATPADEMEGIFARITTELQGEGLSRDQIIRTRLWAVDRTSRDLGSDVRAKYNVGQARAATSSYIMPGRFASAARVSLDLVALKPTLPGPGKIIVEKVPPEKPISYLIIDDLLVLSGKTVVLPTLSEQLDEILPRIAGILSEAGSSWEQVVNVSCHLHKSQKIDDLRKGFAKWVKCPLPRVEVAAVEGYSAVGKLIEVEVTAETFRC